MKEIFISSGELTIGPVTLEKHKTLENQVVAKVEGIFVTVISFKRLKLEWIYGNGYRLISK